MPLWKQILNSNPISMAGEAVAPLWQKILQPKTTQPPAQPMQQPRKRIPDNTKNMEVIGTNYDPYDPDQTRPNTDGRGAIGEIMDESMVATSYKADGITGNLRLGTVFYIPEENKKYLVADVMDKRFSGMSKIDFVTPHQGKKIIEKYNKPFTIQILREGGGYKDAREFIKSGEWDKMKQ